MAAYDAEIESVRSPGETFDGLVVELDRAAAGLRATLR